MSGSQEENRAKVPEKAQQDGEVRARWAWAEAAVWTDRMLTALEEGVKEQPTDGVRHRLEHLVVIHASTICDHLVTCQGSAPER